MLGLGLLNRSLFYHLRGTSLDVAATLELETLELSDELSDLVAHLVAGQNHVDRALLEQKLSVLEALRELLAHGLLNNAWTGKAN